MDIAIDAPGVDALAARFAGAGRVVATEMGAGIRRVATEGQRTAREVTPVHTGALQRGWTVRASATEGVIANALPYARPVNDGRRAGAAMPPAGALLGWMASKGTPAKAEYVVRRAIGRRGIPPKRMREQTIARLRPLAEAEGRAIAARVDAKLRGR